jgi:hypothetical protein
LFKKKKMLYYNKTHPELIRNYENKGGCYKDTMYEMRPSCTEILISEATRNECKYYYQKKKKHINFIPFFFNLFFPLQH